MDGNSAYRGHRQTAKGPQAFGSFLDFLTEGQVLDSLQTVVEEATERMAAMKTEAGVPLVEVRDPVEVPSGRRQTRVRPSLSTVHRHRAQPSLCTGRPNNYPSCSSSMSESHSSLTAGCRGSHSWNSDLGAQGLGSLPPMKDKLLLEKNLKRLLRLEKKGVRSGAMTGVGGRGWTGQGQACLAASGYLSESLSLSLSAERCESSLFPEGLPAMGLTGQPDQHPVDPGAALVLVLRAAGLWFRHS